MTKVKIKTVTLRYDGLFDLDGLYAAVVDWAKTYNYWWHEKMYKHKVPGPEGAEQELEWVIEKKVTDYLKYYIHIEVLIQDMREIEVEVDGKKKMLSNARINIIMSCELDVDWQARFGKSKFEEKVMGWYYKLVVKKNVESDYADQLYYRMMSLHAIMKKYFDMQTKKFAYKRYLGEN